MNSFFASPYYPILVAFISSYLVYHFALERFHREKQYQDKLEKYQVLVDTMRGFAGGVNDQKAKQKFTDHYRAIWLCGSPAVIRLITKFYNTYVDSLNLEINNKREIMTDYLFQVVIEMRKDLNVQGELKKIEDFDFYV